MLTPVERVLILKGADLLKEAGPRQLLRLADVAREIEIARGDTLYREDDPADALYMVVSGRVRLSTAGRVTSEVGPGEAFGTWALVDDSSRGHQAECTEDGLALALSRDDFYDVASGDLTLLQQIIRVLAKRLRALASDRPPEEARVEGEGIEKPEVVTEAEAGTSPEAATPETSGLPVAGAALRAAALGRSERSAPEPRSPAEGGASSASARPEEEIPVPESISPDEPSPT